MRKQSKQFLCDLLEAPSPSGYEQPAQEVVRTYAADFADEVRTDVHGNVIAVLNPEGKPRVMFAGHCDQIGFIVQHIDDDGFLFLNPIGGHDMQVVIGQSVTVWTDSGPLAGVMARKPIHLLDEDKKKVPKMSEVWIDIGVRDKKKVQKLVEIGDPVTWTLGVDELRDGLLYSPGMDDKTGSYVALEALRLLSRRKFPAAVFAVSTVQEEIGLRGATTSAYGIDPDVGIAVDVTFATDHPSMDPKQRGEVSLHKGPVVARGPNINPVVYSTLVKTAKAKKIPYQVCAENRATGTDANVIQISRSGVATGLISVPNRYMHSPVEVVAQDDLDNCAKLLAEFVCALDADTDFTP